VATTLDVQDSDRLWNDLAALQAAVSELNAQDYVRSTVARTVEFLALEGAAAGRFIDSVDQGLHRLDEARKVMEAIHADTDEDPTSAASIVTRRAAWSKWQEEQSAAADGLLAVLHSTPRHGLLAEKRLFWLLRLEYGVRAR
jgi:hypothetical protein